MDSECSSQSDSESEFDYESDPDLNSSLDSQNSYEQDKSCNRRTFDGSYIPNRAGIRKILKATKQLPSDRKKESDLEKYKAKQQKEEEERIKNIAREVAIRNAVIQTQNAGLCAWEAYNRANEAIKKIVKKQEDMETYISENDTNPNLFIKINAPFDNSINKKELYSIYTKYGQVNNIGVSEKDTTRFIYVNFKEPASAASAIRDLGLLNNIEYNNKNVTSSSTVEKKLCRNFAKGNCRFGDKCMFSHEK